MCQVYNQDTALKPIIKWPGGKEKELEFIFPNAPTKINNYYEPFVGGGSVFMAFNANKFFINDKSKEDIIMILIQMNIFYTPIELEQFTLIKLVLGQM